MVNIIFKHKTHQFFLLRIQYFHVVDRCGPRYICTYFLRLNKTNKNEQKTRLTSLFSLLPVKISKNANNSINFINKFRKKFGKVEKYIF